MDMKRLLPIIFLLAATLACSLVSDIAGQETMEVAPIVSPTTAIAGGDDEPAAESQPRARALYLFSPLQVTTTYLMNPDGLALYAWESDYTPGNAVYLLENGNLLRTGVVKEGSFEAGGRGGIVEEIEPDGKVVWSYQFANDRGQLHHDIERMPNGSLLMIAWERKPQAEAIAAGRDPNLLKDGGLWPDHVIEVDLSTNQIVWEWYVWDHLIQDYDATKDNYGVVSEHPGRIDLNYVSRQVMADWTHINSIDYNPNLDQILLSVRGFNEIWIIDHATTTAEAAGPAGDLLYRWGNPQAYGAGTEAEQQFFGQHDAQWIPDGLPGAGNILVFNNGDKQVRPYSSIDELVPPLDADGSYALFSGSSYGPKAPAWSYTAEDPTDFFADHISGAQRLINGNTLVCNGTAGIFFEVTPEGEIVWQYEYGGEVFRVTKIAPSYPGLAGLNLRPGKRLKAESKDFGGSPSGTGVPSGNGGPPPRAIEACSGLTPGAACTMTTENGEVDGVCKSVQDQLVCVPER